MNRREKFTGLKTFAYDPPLSLPDVKIVTDPWWRTRPRRDKDGNLLNLQPEPLPNSLKSANPLEAPKLSDNVED